MTTFNTALTTPQKTLLRSGGYTGDYLLLCISGSSFPIYYTAYTTSADIKYRHQFFLRIAPRAIHFSHTIYIFIAKFSVPAILTFGVSISAFGYHIINVVLCCSQKQMLRIYTSRIVAFVTNKHIVGYFPIFKHIRKPMRRIMRLIVCYLTILVSYTTRPHPTSIGFRGFINMFPKIVNRGCHSVSLSLSHRLLSASDVSDRLSGINLADISILPLGNKEYKL